MGAEVISSLEAMQEDPRREILVVPSGHSDSVAKDAIDEPIAIDTPDPVEAVRC